MKQSGIWASAAYSVEQEYNANKALLSSSWKIKLCKRLISAQLGLHSPFTTTLMAKKTPVTDMVEKIAISEYSLRVCVACGKVRMLSLPLTALKKCEMKTVLLRNRR